VVAVVERELVLAKVVVPGAKLKFGYASRAGKHTLSVRVVLDCPLVAASATLAVTLPLVLLLCTAAKAGHKSTDPVPVQLAYLRALLLPVQTELHLQAAVASSVSAALPTQLALVLVRAVAQALLVRPPAQAAMAFFKSRTSEHEA
jgi:hypothetical protein